ncbi:hypothetical protein HSX10_13875 [Winogradskyella undariae]|uniref:hypothetical protein n=1 Tax=Winogradskyella undariae TaxID=1285465 RepID=UPI00156ACCC5|nr:hypothetical protein [Winogradskyella undariae]NRR92658.1 hypothetical protein [Winogradskyella undariae]
MSFSSSKNINNDIFEYDCDQSYTIDGGLNCPFNGTYHGWCSEAEFEQYAESVYDSEGCGDSIPKEKVVVISTEP